MEYKGPAEVRRPPPLPVARSVRVRPGYLRPVVDQVPVLDTPRFETPNHPDLAPTDRFLNRELTWLNFNWRVASLARDERTPLLERVKFAAIVARNLDEFCMKRLTKLLRAVATDPKRLSRDGRAAADVLATCRKEMERLNSEVAQIYELLKSELSKEGIEIVRASSLVGAEKDALRDVFREQIYPFVTPHALNGSQPFPHLPGLSLNMLVRMRAGARGRSALVDVPVGGDCPRFVAIPIPGKRVYVAIEQVVAEHLEAFFPDYSIESVDLFRVIRGVQPSAQGTTADLDRAANDRFVLERFAPVVQIEVASSMPQHTRDGLAKRLGVGRSGIQEINGFIGFRDLFELSQIDQPHLSYPVHEGRVHPQLARDVFASLRRRSVLAFHPFHRFDQTVLRFLETAAEDPAVRIIKMSLYRAAEASRVIRALETAAKNNKRVVVLFELNASFDESRNLYWAKRLTRVGARVSFSAKEKLHGKALLVVRKEANGPRTYAHLGTGNYNEKTANHYGDVGLFTADPKLTLMVNQFFNAVTTGTVPVSDPNRFWCTPRTMRQALLERIEREATHAREGRRSRIRFKCNGLEDPKLIRALYDASSAGVKIDLLVRDCCSLRPGVRRLSDNIRVVSVLGRFLEHARVFHFYNDGTEEYWIGSADCMRRNLTKRLEILVNVTEKELQRELDQLLRNQLTEHATGAWEMRPDGSYIASPMDDEAPDAQTGFEEWLLKRDQQRSIGESEFYR